jgi:hypothetical protein
MTREFPGLLSLSLITFWGTGLLSAQPAVPPEPTVLVEIQNQAAPASPEMNRRDRLCDGARVVLLYPDGRRVTVSEGLQSACEPDVSYDGRKILFSGKPSFESSWDIFEFEIDSGKSRQITRDAGNCRSPIYLSTYYIITANDPWLQILFVSDAANEINESGSGRALDLYSCQLDGSEIKRITYNPSSDQDPFLCWDGRILFSSRRAGTPGSGNGQTKIFNMNVDGTDLAAFSGQQGAPVQQMPMVTTSSLAVFIESDSGSGDGGGTLGSVSLRRPMHTYRKLTDSSDGIFFSPAPLPDGSLLVSRKSSLAAERYVLVRLDPETGSITPWLSDSKRSLLYGRVVKARPQPDGRSSVVNENHPFGQFYCLNVGINDLQDGSLLRAKAKRIRVLEGLPVHSGSASPPSGPPLLPKRILGEAPLEADGSVFFEVPANIPVQLQVIDDSGMALRTCGWIWVRNKEPRGCIGCHEDGELVPDNRLVDAVRRPPTSLTAPARLRRYIDFRRDVLPVIADGCATASCHNGQSSGPDLHPPEENGASAEFADRVYAILTGGTGAGKEDPGLRWVDPGRARTSPLIWHILGKNTSMPWDNLAASQAAAPPNLGRPLVEPTLSRVLIEWIDLGAHGGSRVNDTVQTELKRLSGGDE